MRAISFLFGVLLLAQDNTAVQVSGIVVNAAGEPIAGVMVKVENERTLWQSGAGTRSDGRFVLSGLLPGTYIMRAEKAGFQQEDPALPASGTPYPGLVLTVLRDQPVKDIRLRLAPADAIFSGRIVDENREPLASVQVALLERIYDPHGSPIMSKIATATTDETGEYRISGIGNGDYYLRVEPSPGVTPTFLPTYYPGGTDPARAIPVTVSANGQLWSTNLSVFRSKGYTVRMKLTSATPIPSTLGFTVMGAPAATHQAIGDDTHLFHNVPPGSYRIFMSCPRYSDCTISQLVPVNVVDRDVDLGAVALKPGVSISGRIVTNGILPERFAGRIVLDPPSPWSGAMISADVSPDGTFTLPPVRDGRYHLWISGLPDGLYIEAARYGGKDVMDGGLLIDGTAQPLEVLISGPSGGISGVVRNAKGEPMPNIGVVVVPSVNRRGNPHLYFFATTDQTGSFSISGVTPGDYGAFAWEHIPKNAYRNAEWFKAHENQALRVTVRRGLQTNADLRLIPRQR